jgi:abortive infection bacteriophage resistance protein
MTQLDDAMKEHMAYLVFREHKPFCYKDFQYFEVNGKAYNMSHGTFRNKIGKMIQNNVVNSIGRCKRF